MGEVMPGGNVAIARAIMMDLRHQSFFILRMQQRRSTMLQGYQATISGHAMALFPQVRRGSTECYIN